MASMTRPSVSGLAVPAARWALGAAWLFGLTWNFMIDYPEPPSTLTLIAFGILVVGGTLLTTPGDGPLDPIRAHLVAGCSVAVFVVSLQRLAPGDDTFFGDLGSYLSALLIARGNPVLGGLGVAGVMVAALCWAGAAGATPIELGALLTVPVMAATMGATWRVVLGRMVASERAQRSAAARSVREAEAAREAAETTRRELAGIRDALAPLLRRIIAGEPLDPEFQLELRVVEGALRDRIRTPALRHPSLVATIAERRRAGVDVVLLGGQDAPAGDAVASTIGSIVAAARAGRVTVRLMPPGRESAASVLVEQDDAAVRTTIAPDGAVLLRH